MSVAIDKTTKPAKTFFFEISKIAGRINMSKPVGSYNFVIKVEKSKPAPRHKKDRSKKENYKARSSSRPKNRLRQSFAKRKYRKKKN